MLQLYSSIVCCIVGALVVGPAAAKAGHGAAPQLHVNTSLVHSGAAVRVSWTGLDLENIRGHKTVWSEVAPSGPSNEGDQHVEPSCTVVTEEGEGPLYWLAQFSPPVTKAEDIEFTGNPNLNVDGVSTEGTPPFISPAPVKFISGKQLSKGYFDFVVTNHRADVNWVLFQSDLNQIKITPDTGAVAFSEPIEMMHQSHPSGVRLGRMTKSHEVRVSWTSTEDRVGHQMVTWGLAPNTVSEHAASTPSTNTYSASDLCGSPANSSGFHDPGTFFTTVLDLSCCTTAASRAQGLRIYYQVIDKELDTPAGGWPVRSFLAPKPAAADTSLSILVTADMGETYEDGSQYHWEEPSAVNTTLQMQKTHPDADILMHPGDLAYATGYESEWDRFMEQIEVLSDSMLYMTGQGNHERDFPSSGNTIGRGDSGGECGVPTQARFINPTCQSPNTEPCLERLNGRDSGSLEQGMAPPFGPKSGPPDDGWYSFEQGPVHFLMLNTEHNSSQGSRQHTFVKNDLASVNRSITPWVLVFGHRQMYAYNISKPGNSLGDLEPLMIDGKVDIAFWGHIHFAQASCPMKFGRCVPDEEADSDGWKGVIHTVIGNAGQSLTPISLPMAPWTTYNASEWGWSHVAVSNASHLRMDFYADVPIGEKPPVHYSFEINRNR